MAATLRTPEIAQAHAGNLFYQVMDFLTAAGMLEYIPDASRGGSYIQRPHVGRLAGGVAEVTNVSSPTSSATVRSTTYKNESMVNVYRHKLTDWSISQPLIAGVDENFYAMDMGRQFAALFAQSLLVDLYRVGIASAKASGIAHSSSVFVDTATAGNQVDLTANVIQDAKYLLGDHMERIGIGVCHPKQWNDLRLEQITDSNFVVPNVVGDLLRGVLFVNILGVTWIIDQQMHTNYVDGTGNPSNATLYNALMARSSSMDMHGMAPWSVSFQQALRIDTQHVLGEQVRRNQMQGFMAYGLGVRGSGWDVDNGGANPSLNNMGLATNWDAATDDTRRHGVIHIATN